MSDEAKEKRFENEEAESDDVEAHSKGGERLQKLGTKATDEGDDGDDVEAHFKSGKLA